MRLLRLRRVVFYKISAVVIRSEVHGTIGAATYLSLDHILVDPMVDATVCLITGILRPRIQGFLNGRARINLSGPTAEYEHEWYPG